MLNKLDFNNLVVTNKKKIQRIKAHSIQKLVQKIKKLKYLLDKKPEHEKNKERFRKATFILDEMKKLKCVILMKNVLVLEKAPSAILTNGLSSPEEMAVAMVATNNDMQELTKVFKEKLGITNENKVWKNELMQASKKQIKILKTEKKRQSRKDSKEQKAIARKRVEWLKNQNILQDQNGLDDNSNETLKGYDEGANISTLGYWKIESIEDKFIDKPAMNAPIGRKDLPKKQLSITKKENKKRNDITKNIPKVVSDPADLIKNKCIDKNEKNTIENSLHDRLDSVAELNLKESLEVDAPEDNTTHVIDPFFITNSGENYRSSAVVVRNGKALNTEDYNPREGQKFVAGKYINSTRDNYNSVNSKSKVNNNNKVQKNIIANLHPSWAAKQKLKPVIGSFQGKKIKFDDEDKRNSNEENKIYNSKSDDAKSQVMSNKRKYFSESKSEELHPSWAAKQKFKATITEFRGKKTTFGDEGNTEHLGDVVKPLKGGGESKNLTDGLHPSWLAKQKQKPAIASFQGKKITFEDND